MMKNVKNCFCGNQMNQVVGTVTHIVFNREIHLHDVPHYKCSVCERSEYDIQEVNVVKVLREAYLSNISHVQYPL
jgi:hypothetical protein